VDEVGRGALAGPVFAAAVLFSKEVLKDRERIFQGQIKDSKLLTPLKRERLFLKISEYAKLSLSSVSSRRIDEINILEATRAAMRDAVLGLGLRPDVVLIDGNIKLDLDYKQISIPGGDSLCFSISAASIAAKVKRDKYMVDIGSKYKYYNFSKNKGYGTKEHIESLYLYGPSEIHRESFAPLRHILLDN
jgi:ribonuclease HII